MEVMKGYLAHLQLQTMAADVNTLLPVGPLSLSLSLSGDQQSMTYARVLQ